MFRLIVSVFAVLVFCGDSMACGGRGLFGIRGAIQDRRAERRGSAQGDYQTVAVPSQGTVYYTSPANCPGGVCPVQSAPSLAPQQQFTPVPQPVVIPPPTPSAGSM